MFINSKDINNSLIDVVSLNKSRDSNVFNELKYMFNNDNNRISKTLDLPTTANSNSNYNNYNVISIKDKTIEKEKSKSLLEEEGF